MNQKFRKAILFFQLMAGAADTTTGALLITAPEWTLRLMNVSQIPAAAIFISYIGVFVFSVGLSYLWAFFFWARNPNNVAQWRAQWTVTALIRSFVAIFVLWNVSTLQLELSWLSVGVTDGVIALLQWVGLTRGWLSNEE